MFNLKSARVSLNTLVNYSALFIIFSGALTLRFVAFAEFRIAYLIILVILVIWVCIFREVYMSKGFFVFFALIVLLSLGNVFIDRGSTVGLLKQTVGIFISAVLFYNLVKINKYDIERLFKAYLNIAVVVALIGLFQEACYLSRFTTGYDFSYIFPYWRAIFTSDKTFIRVNSILPEATIFCMVMMPALFVSLTAFFNNQIFPFKKWKGMVIILSFFFTFSSVGYLGIILAIIIISLNLFRLRYLMITIPAISMIFFVFYSTVYDFQRRVNDSISVLQGNSTIEDLNFSTFTFFSHVRVAGNGFKESPLFGSGLGAYEGVWKRYIFKVITLDKSKIKELSNDKDANSLFLRLLVETGLFGVCLVLFFIFRFYIRKKEDPPGRLWLINNSILCMFILRLIRQGHYFSDGVFFFVWLYYFAWHNSRARKSANGIKC